MALVSVGQEFRVNTATAGDQTLASIVELAGGEVVVVWTDEGQGSVTVKAQMFAGDGTPIGDEMTVSSAGVGDQYPAVAVPLSGGGFLVAYQTDGGQARLEVFDADGGRLETEALGDMPVVAPLAGGGFVAGRSVDIGGRLEGVIGLYDETGAPTGAVFMAEDADDNQRNLTLAPLEGGGFVAAWAKLTNGQTDIFAQAYAADGTPGVRVQVNSQADGVQTAPHVEGLAGGGYVVIWRDEELAGDGSDWAILGQAFDASGQPAGSEFRVNTATAGSQFYRGNVDPIVALPGGGFAVAWVDEGAGAAKAQLFDATGGKVGGEVDLGWGDPGGLAVLADGSILVTQHVTSNGVYDVRASLISPQGELLDVMPIVNTATAGDQWRPLAQGLDGGGAFIVWRDYSAGAGGAGGDASGGAVKAQVVRATVDPDLAIPGGGAAYVEPADGSSGGVALAPTLSLADGDSAGLAGATVSISGNRQPGDTLALESDGLSMGDIVGVYDAAAGALTLSSASGTATLAQWQAALRAVKFATPDQDPSGAPRAVTFTVSDADGGTGSATLNLSVAATNDVPVLAGPAGAVSYAEGGAPVAVAANLTVEDLDNDSLTGATVEISAGFQAGADVLSFLGQGGISGTYDATTGRLTLSGAASLADYQAVLRTVTFSNGAETPSTAQRVISLSVSDGGGTSAVLTRAVSVSADTPTPPAQPPPPPGPTAGDDRLNLDDSQTLFDAGDGDDFVNGAAVASTITGGAGADSVAGGAGDDMIHGNVGDDQVFGGGGQDVVRGGQGQDFVHGNPGDDLLFGDLGADTVHGGQGDDIVAGGSGDDWLSGDRGSDTLEGGAGADVFHSWGEAALDVVTDFNFAEGDRVNLLAGTVWSAAQVGADTVISMTGGGQLVLQNVQLAALEDGWIV